MSKFFSEFLERHGLSSCPPNISLKSKLPHIIEIRIHIISKIVFELGGGGVLADYLTSQAEFINSLEQWN